VVDGAVAFSPLLWAKCLSKSAGLLLLDELTNINRPDVISAAYKLIFDRRAGFTKFHDDVFIVACGNRPEHSTVANYLPTPLINRMLVISVDPPKVDDWMEFMQKTYGDEWDKKCYAFLKRFEDEDYLLKVPKQAECLEAYPTPRSWTAAALLMYRGLNSDDTLCGLLGYEVATKLQAFLKVKVDIDELIKDPSLYDKLSLDGKYMAAVMLSTWVEKHNSASKAFPLIDKMSNDSRELLVLTCLGMSRKRLVGFLRELFAYNAKYKDFLDEVALKLKNEISA
jgi:hypothetical protein